MRVFIIDLETFVVDRVKFDYPIDVRFCCVRCGICCGDTSRKLRHVLLLESEANELASRTGLEVSEFSYNVHAKVPYEYEMKKSQEGKCVFLRNSMCAVYEFRPLICRFYPFELKSENGKTIFSFTDECPGLGEGKNLSQVYFKTLFRQAQIRLGSVRSSTGTH